MTATHPTMESSESARAAALAPVRDHDAVRSELQRLLEDLRHRTAAYSPQAGTLWQQIARAVHGGKLTRPSLVQLGYRAFGGRERERSITLGCAFELLHAALLMHDDVIDQDFMRRGRPTLSAHYRDLAAQNGLGSDQARHVGSSAAIIAGDLLLSTAIRQVARAAAGLPAAEAVGQAFELAIAQAGAGELEDLLYSVQSVPANTAQVMRMEELKTAGYSFQMPLKCGALLAGASERQAEDLGEIGCRFGVAYQIIDDILGSFGDPRATGKSVESDLREGKSTVLTALAGEDPSFRRALADFRDDRLDLEQLRDALQETGAVQVARELAVQLCASALQSPQFLELPVEVQQELGAYPDFILDRKL